MVDVKLSLIVELPGAVPFSKQLCFKNSSDGLNREVPIDGMTDEHHFDLKLFDKKTKKEYNKRYFFRTRKCEPAYQTVNMSYEAYEAMTSDSRPDKFRPEGMYKPTELNNAWKALTEQQKLEWHLDYHAKALGGRVLSYHVYGD